MVNSLRGIPFHIWATQVLCEYLVKGFAMNDDLLKRAGGGRSHLQQGRCGQGFYVIAKNYLSPDELDTLSRIVSLYLDSAELQAKSHKPMYMKDWIQKLD